MISRHHLFKSEVSCHKFKHSQNKIKIPSLKKRSLVLMQSITLSEKSFKRLPALSVSGRELCADKKNCVHASVSLTVHSGLVPSRTRQTSCDSSWNSLHISLSLPMITCVTASVCSFNFCKEKPEHSFVLFLSALPTKPW